jgi:hypothetical protein
LPIITSLRAHTGNRQVATKFSYWISQITEKSTLYKSLKLLNGKFQFGRCHSVATTITANIRDIVRLPIRLKIVTGTYILQQNRAAYKNSNLVATCLLPVCARSDVMDKICLIIFLYCFSNRSKGRPAGKSVSRP